MVRGKGRRSPRKSVTSIRSVSGLSTTRASRNPRPATRPWVTALVASSATTMAADSLTEQVSGQPHWASCCTANSRARRAPRGVELRSWVKRRVDCAAAGAAGAD
ncbi:hypothetical protein SNL152K_9463 [Streptomyces sp. NL15-2K]|nr:hypothetical protein SNL152K_9463 [Streptomyces sp. NL15-2K]